jgi:hypothetical protein
VEVYSVDKNDWYFAISSVLAILALLGLDWKLVKGRLPMPQLGWHNSLFVFLIVASLAVSAIGWYKSSQHEDYKFRFSDAPLVEVRGKRFLNERVVIDGYRYTFCNFENVTLVYNGTAPFGLDNNQFYGSRNIFTDNPSIAASAMLMKALGMVKPDTPLVGGPDFTPMHIEPPREGK